MLLGLVSGGAHEKTIRQIARNLKIRGGYFFSLHSPKGGPPHKRGGRAQRNWDQRRSCVRLTFHRPASPSPNREMRFSSDAQRSRFRRRSALRMTDTELNVIATLAIIGLSKSPKNG
jgi:hypothetical protein